MMRIHIETGLRYAAPIAVLILGSACQDPRQCSAIQSDVLRFAGWDRDTGKDTGVPEDRAVIGQCLPEPSDLSGERQREQNQGDQNDSPSQLNSRSELTLESMPGRFQLGLSRSFRGRSHEPEIVAATRTPRRRTTIRTLRIAARYLICQSNGRRNPLSGSRRREAPVICAAGESRATLVGPSSRIKERFADDNNPSVVGDLARTDTTLIHAVPGHGRSLNVRSSLRAAAGGHVGAHINRAFPIASALNDHAQLSTGYGGCLIDYNHNATCAGPGRSLLEQP